MSYQQQQRRIDDAYMTAPITPEKQEELTHLHHRKKDIEEHDVVHRKELERTLFDLEIRATNLALELDQKHKEEIKELQRKLEEERHRSTEKINSLRRELHKEKQLVHEKINSLVCTQDTMIIAFPNGASQFDNSATHHQHHGYHPRAHRENQHHYHHNPSYPPRN